MRRILFTFLFVAAAAVFGALYGASAASADEGVLTQGLPTGSLDIEARAAGDGTAGAHGPGGTRTRFTGRITADLAVDLAGRVPTGPDGGPLDCPLPEDMAGHGLELPELPEIPELPEAPELPDLPDGGDGLDGLTDQLSPVCDCLAGLADLAGGDSLDGLDGLDAMAGAVPDPGDIPTMLESPESALVGPMVAMSQMPSPVGDVPITLLQLQQQLAG
jgi:hypothetical protein